MGSDYGGTSVGDSNSPIRTKKLSIIEKLAIDSLSRDSYNGGAGGYYNYEPGHKYALTTVNTEFRNKLSNTEMNIY